MKKILVVIIVGFLLSVLVFWITLPDVSGLKWKNPKKTSFMAFREHESMTSGQKSRIHQEWVPFSRFSPFLIKALVIAEDSQFWHHEGFDYEAIQNAIKKDIQLKKFKKGGSTLTQQLAKNLYLSPEKSLMRKMKEAIITWQLERKLSKRRILEIYLNIVEWGDGIYGAEAASRLYFGKPASELTAMESARLVSVLPNPRKYHPDGNQKYVVNRSEMIYQIMVDKGIILPELQEETRDKNESPVPSSDMPAPQLGDSTIEDKKPSDPN